MSLARTGRHPSEETKVKLRAACLGRPGHIPSVETRAKMSAAAQGKKWSDETRQKMREYWTYEVRKKFGESISGARGPAWKGGIAHANPYEFIYIRPKFYLSKHRLLMQKLINRKLITKEQVHHVNKKKKDNRLENLALCSNLSAHNWAHTEEAKIFFG